MLLKDYLSINTFGFEIEFASSYRSEFVNFVKSQMGSVFDAYAENDEVAEVSTPPIRLLEYSKLLKALKVGVQGIKYSSVEDTKPFYVAGEATLVGSMHIHIGKQTMVLNQNNTSFLLLLLLPLFSRTGYTFRNVKIITVYDNIPYEEKGHWLNLRHNTFEFRINEFVPITAPLIPLIVHLSDVINEEFGTVKGKSLLKVFRAIYIDLLSEGYRESIYPGIYLRMYQKFAKKHKAFKNLVLSVMNFILDVWLDILKADNQTELIKVYSFVKDNLEELYFPKDYFEKVNKLEFRRYKNNPTLLAKKVAKELNDSIGVQVRAELMNLIDSLVA